jgi:hypothetical protein
MSELGFDTLMDDLAVDLNTTNKDCGYTRSIYRARNGSRRVKHWTWTIWQGQITNRAVTFALGKAEMDRFADAYADAQDAGCSAGAAMESVLIDLPVPEDARIIERGYIVQ